MTAFVIGPEPVYVEGVGQRVADHGERHVEDRILATGVAGDGLRDGQRGGDRALNDDGCTVGVVLEKVRALVDRARDRRVVDRAAVLRAGTLVDGRGGERHRDAGTWLHVAEIAGERPVDDVACLVVDAPGEARRELVGEHDIERDALADVGHGDVEDEILADRDRRVRRRLLDRDVGAVQGHGVRRFAGAVVDGRDRGRVVVDAAGGRRRVAHDVDRRGRLAGEARRRVDQDLVRSRTRDRPARPRPDRCSS